MTHLGCSVWCRASVAAVWGSSLPLVKGRAAADALAGLVP